MGALKMWEMKLQDMIMWHITVGMENAREGKWGSKNADVKSWEELCMESHNNVND